MQTWEHKAPHLLTEVSRQIGQPTVDLQSADASTVPWPEAPHEP
jgi:hypothetical protein